MNVNRDKMRTCRVCRRNSEGKAAWRQIPFHNIETGDPILSSYSIQITTEDSHAHTGPASACRGHVTAPLIGLRIISGQETWQREKLSSKERTHRYSQDWKTNISSMKEKTTPLYWVEIRRAIVTAHCIQQVVQNTDSHSTSPFAHRRHHPPLVGLWIVALHAGNGISTAPAPNCQSRKRVRKWWDDAPYNMIPQISLQSVWCILYKLPHCQGRRYKHFQ